MAEALKIDILRRKIFSGIFIKRVFYRLWQFCHTLCPVYSKTAWHKACLGLKPAVKQRLNLLSNAEKAHVMRVYKGACQCVLASETEKEELKALALVHDIGKTFTKPSIFFKVIRVLFNLPNSTHCIKGARFLRQCGCDKRLVIRVLRHHTPKSADELLKKFMLIDDCS